MFENPQVRFYARALVAGLGSFLGILQATGFDEMGTGDWVNAAIAGLIVALGFAGFTAATPIDQSVGVKKGGNK